MSFSRNMGWIAGCCPMLSVLSGSLPSHGRDHQWCYNNKSNWSASKAIIMWPENIVRGHCKRAAWMTAERHGYNHITDTSKKHSLNKIKFRFIERLVGKLTSAHPIYVWSHVWPIEAAATLSFPSSGTLITLQHTLLHDNYLHIPTPT